MKKILTLALFVFTTALFANQTPGEGVTVHPMKSSIAEETFQTEVINRALEELGYNVTPIEEVSYPVIYETMAQNSDSDDIYYLAVSWKPLHDNFYKKVGGDKKLYRKGTFIKGCAQGYLIDKKTAEKYDIKYINDLKDPKIAKVFDKDGDGKADLSGCNPGWGCEAVIEHQLDAFDLRDTIEHNQGEYSAIIADTITRYKKGESVLYYTWTPYWVSGKLVPGKDVKWLQVTHTEHPSEEDTSLPNGANYGFNVNNMHIVANKSVADKHKAAAKLFAVAKMDVNDISAQNMLMAQGQKSKEAIDKHVDSWIKANRETFDSWLKQARAAAQ
jgi:glycine betaine/proline transport system substrate-binding protein